MTGRLFCLSPFLTPLLRIVLARSTSSARPSVSGVIFTNPPEVSRRALLGAMATAFLASSRRGADRAFQSGLRAMLRWSLPRKRRHARSYTLPLWLGAIALRAA